MRLKSGETALRRVQVLIDLDAVSLIIVYLRKSLTTIDSKCVRIASFEGGGDDMDWPIKQTLLTNNENNKRFFCGVNSYNIGRPLVQMVHWVSTKNTWKEKKIETIRH